MITVIRTKDYLYLYFLGAEAQARCPADEIRPPERDAAAGLQEQGLRSRYTFIFLKLYSPHISVQISCSHSLTSPAVTYCTGIYSIVVYSMYSRVD